MKSSISWVIVVVLIVGLGYLLIQNKNSPKSETQDLQSNNQNNMQNEQGREIKIAEGLTAVVTKEGTGPEVKSGDTVEMNYTGKLVDGTVFDSSVLPEFGHVQTFTTQIGVGRVIQGWDLGVVGMKVGEKRVMTIASELAYGANSPSPKIPVNATLIFEMELVSIK